VRAGTAAEARVCADRARPPGDRARALLLHRAVDLTPEQEAAVVAKVIEVQAPRRASGHCGPAARLDETRKARTVRGPGAGVVLDGPVTDLAELLELRLPVFARGISALTTRRLNLGGTIGEPITCGGVRVEVGDYVLGDEMLWPRIGTQFQHQIADRARREVCWVKYGDARKFECWRWDDRWIYHEVDHALDGDAGIAASFDKSSTGGVARRARSHALATRRCRTAPPRLPRLDRSRTPRRRDVHDCR